MSEYQGNRRYVNNAENPRCKHCGLFVKTVDPDTDGLKRYRCSRCGPVMEHTA